MLGLITSVCVQHTAFGIFEAGGLSSSFYGSSVLSQALLLTRRGSRNDRISDSVGGRRVRGPRNGEAPCSSVPVRQLHVRGHDVKWSATYVHDDVCPTVKRFIHVDKDKADPRPSSKRLSARVLNFLYYSASLSKTHKFKSVWFFTRESSVKPKTPWLTFRSFTGNTISFWWLGRWNRQTTHRLIANNTRWLVLLGESKATVTTYKSWTCDCAQNHLIRTVKHAYSKLIRISKTHF